MMNQVQVDSAKMSCKLSGFSSSNENPVIRHQYRNVDISPNYKNLEPLIQGRTYFISFQSILKSPKLHKNLANYPFYMLGDIRLPIKIAQASTP